MNAYESLRAVSRILGGRADDRRVLDTLVAGGVAAATAEPGRQPPGLVPLLGGLFAGRTDGGAALVPWTDPVALFERDPAAAPRLADEWAEACAGTPGVRLSVSAARGAGHDFAALLRSGRHVAAVSCTAPPTPATCPGWSWPLPVALFPDGAPAERADLARRLAARSALWRECVVETVPDGRWARPALVLCRADARAARGPTAAVAIALLEPGRAHAGTDALLDRVAARHGTTSAALADTGGDVVEWLVAVLSAMAHDAPLDVALDWAATAVGAPLTALRADPRLLDTTRLSEAIARTGIGSPGGSGWTRTLPDPGTLPAPGSRPSPGAYPETADAEAGMRRWSRLLREVQSDRYRQPHRVVRTSLVEAAEAPSGPTALRPGTDYRLTVWVGRPGRESAAQEPLPTASFVPDRTHRLRITAVQLHGSPPPRAGQFQDVDLPPVGRSGKAVFTVSSGASGSPFQVRVTVFHRHRFLQSGVLSGTVGSGEAPTFEIDAVVRADTDDLAARTPHDAALALGTDAGGEPLLTTVTPDAVEIRAPAGLATTISALTAALRDPADHPEKYGGYHSAAYEQLLISLAQSGQALFRGLFGERIGLVPRRSAEALRRADSVSVLAARPGDLLPLELVYDKPLRVGGPLGIPGRLCADAPALTGPRDCAARCPGHGDDGVVCPFGFWGASKVIERYVHADRSAGLAKDFALAIGPAARRGTIEVGTSLLTAACDRADRNAQRAWSTAVRLLGAESAPVATWRELAHRTQRLRDGGEPPGVLLLVVHSETVPSGPARGTICLVLGEDDRLSLHETLDPLLTGPAELNPLVLLLGCRTADHRTPLLGAQLRMLEAGAPGVVGTLAPVLARHIVPVAVELMAEIARMAGQAGAGLLLGEALTRARRTSLLKGEACALALVGYGDTDWEVRAVGGVGTGEGAPG
ncbi:CHAT domain-containing protein [Streptomyces lavenduligriseus]|uniref:CHAT domain-containing protein n=1 Tax=Streptomyces lavenduligriseus TaxID=67315 RepID=A0ABT0NVM2_9ACTN|nr:CHAT domain-containing protein [Streptomyces lavenduligriseus]MCL3995514.1 CHAT domain-containing protein [Streptomyces lavenduligriseus]